MTGFKAQAVSGSNVCYLMPKVVNDRPALSRPCAKMVASQFGGPAISWSP